MIYTITFNPALDYVMQIQNLAIGNTNRSQSEKIVFGGKGINVSCVLKELGIESTALGFIAGFTGEAIENHLKSICIKTDFIKLNKGLTRINVKLKGECITEINGSGPLIEKKDIDILFEKLDDIQSGDTLVLSGSIPKSLPDDIYEKIMQKLEDRNIRFIVDAEKDLLVNSLKYKPFLIKPNLEELSAIANKALEKEEDIISAAQSLQNKGALNVLVTLGKDGAVLLDNSGNITKKTAHKIRAVNTVGAGDSMIAGFLAGIDKGFDYALELGSAAGASTAETDGLASKEDIMKKLN